MSQHTIEKLRNNVDNGGNFNIMSWCTFQTLKTKERALKIVKSLCVFFSCFTQIAIDVELIAQTRDKIGKKERALIDYIVMRISY